MWAETDMRPCQHCEGCGADVCGCPEPNYANHASGLPWARRVGEFYFCPTCAPLYCVACAGTATTVVEGVPYCEDCAMDATVPISVFCSGCRSTYSSILAMHRSPCERRVA